MAEEVKETVEGTVKSVVYHNDENGSTFTVTAPDGTYATTRAYYLNELKA